MKESSKLLLKQLSDLLSELNEHSYSAGLSVLNGNSIGKHVRHILDLYECLIQGTEKGIINYDARKREVKIETSPSVALERLQEIQVKVENLDLNKEIQMIQKLGEVEVQLKSQVQRELLYNIEHTVHHLAIIRIGIEQSFPQIEIPDNFGIAFSTLNYRESQA